MKDEVSELAGPAGVKLNVLPAAAGGYRSGQLVEVRSLSEILATLDAAGTLDGMPFMPEMVRYCGQTLQGLSPGRQDLRRGPGCARHDRRGNRFPAGHSLRRRRPRRLPTRLPDLLERGLAPRR